jgi:hypothetical protein
MHQDERHRLGSRPGEGEEPKRRQDYDSFERIIAVDGPIEPTLQDKLAEIADKCPVHRTW